MFLQHSFFQFREPFIQPVKSFHVGFFNLFHFFTFEYDRTNLLHKSDQQHFEQ